MNQTSVRDSHSQETCIQKAIEKLSGDVFVLVPARPRCSSHGETGWWRMISSQSAISSRSRARLKLTVVSLRHRRIFPVAIISLFLCSADMKIVLILSSCDGSFWYWTVKSNLKYSLRSTLDYYLYYSRFFKDYGYLIARRVKIRSAQTSGEPVIDLTFRVKKLIAKRSVEVDASFCDTLFTSWTDLR